MSKTIADKRGRWARNLSAEKVSERMSVVGKARWTNVGIDERRIISARLLEARKKKANERKTGNN